MITEIGIVAGEIWRILEKNDKVVLSSLIDSLNRPKEVILMSLGWLAREGHVIVEICGGDYWVYLRRKKQ